MITLTGKRDNPNGNHLNPNSVDQWELITLRIRWRATANTTQTLPLIHGLPDMLNSSRLEPIAADAQDSASEEINNPTQPSNGIDNPNGIRSTQLTLLRFSSITTRTTRSTHPLKFD